MASIVLVGPMGSGKTTLGKRLAKELQLEFLDTDKLIARDHGAITKIFSEKGEEHFRNLETQYLRDSLDGSAVIATGGGIVIREENRGLLKGQVVVFLDTDSEHVLGKINLSKRPLLKDNPERWEEIYNERKPLYESVATATVYTGGRSIKTLIQELKELISQ
jgi:shikimate kinase